MVTATQMSTFKPILCDLPGNIQKRSYKTGGQ
jgi:hypothetical protein